MRTDVVRKSFFVLPVIVTMLAACADQQSPLPLVGTLERDRINIVAESFDRIEEIAVTEGERVSGGQLLVRLDATRQDVALREALGERDRVAQRLAELIRGPRAEAIAEAQARLKGAQDNLAVQTRENRRIADLVERNLLADNDLDRSRNSVETAEASVATLRAALDALIVGTTAEELAQAQAALAVAEAVVDARRIAVERQSIRAPRDGIVEAVPFRRGAQPRAGDTVIALLADTAPFARVYVPEPLRAQVGAGTQATILVDGIQSAFAGRVRYVAVDAAFTPYYSLTERDRSRLSFLSEVTLLDETAANLPAGVAVEVNFPELAQ